MEIEAQEEHMKEIRLPPSHDSLGNSPRSKMTTPTRVNQPPRKPWYRECLKNHAAGIGGHAVDGCREFLPSGAEGTIDALKCAACNCHRNFHRKEAEADTVAAGGESLSFSPHHFLPPQRFSRYHGTPSEYLQVLPAQRGLALRPSTGGGGGSHSREEQEDMPNPGGGGPGVSRKRVRTKFSREQKEKMLGLAERLGWRLQKQDEAVIHHFCNETGVKRQVFKVWMHNNKHTLGKKP